MTAKYTYRVYRCSSGDDSDSTIDYDEFRSEKKQQRDLHRLWLTLAGTALLIILIGHFRLS